MQLFKSMGSGSQSGKLIFKSINSGDSISIVDGPDSITISSIVINSPIDVNQIVYGTGNGITSSYYFMIKGSNSTAQLYGFGTVQSNPGTFSNRNDSYTNSFIVGGYSNYINSLSKNSQIIGGCSNTIYNSYGYIYNGTIIGGQENNIISSSSSMINGGLCNNTCYSQNSIIIGGACNINSNSIKFNSILTSVCSSISNSNCHNSIISSNQSNIGTCSSFGVIISSYKTYIYGTVSTNNNSILGSIDSTIKNSNYSTILSSDDSQILASFSSIISSSRGCISSPFSEIIASCYNSITTSTYSSILSSKNSDIIFSYNTSIISSNGSMMAYSYLSSIFSNCNSTICSSKYSNLFSGCINTIINTSNFTIFSGERNNGISNNDIISNTFSNEFSFGAISGSGITSSFVSLGGEGNVSYSLGISIGGKGNISGRTSVIGAYGTCLEEDRQTPHSTIMLGGESNKSGSNFSGIIAGGFKNTVINSINTSIISGDNNSIISKGQFANSGESFGPTHSVCDSFIIGGSFNRFTAKACFTYNSNGGRQIFSSGILGGCNNNVYSKDPDIKVVDSTIIAGGFGISASNTGLHIPNLLIFGDLKTGKYNSYFCGFSGTVASPSVIRVINGIITCVT